MKFTSRDSVSVPSICRPRPAPGFARQACLRFPLPGLRGHLRGQGAHWSTIVLMVFSLENLALHFHVMLAREVARPAPPWSPRDVAHLRGEVCPP